MNWIEELDKHGYNFLVDELVWHLEQGRMPVSIVKRKKGNEVGFDFCFENEEPHFLKVTPEMLDEHWNEAQEITAGFPLHKGVKYVGG